MTLGFYLLTSTFFTFGAVTNKDYKKLRLFYTWLTGPIGIVYMAINGMIGGQKHSEFENFLKGESKYPMTIKKESVMGWLKGKKK